MQRVLWAFALIVPPFAPSYSYADFLWDQQPNTDLVAAVDQQFVDFPDFNTYIVNDATFNTDVVIDSVTTYYTNINQNWPFFAHDAVLNIFDGDVLTSDDEPTMGGDFGPGHINITVTELSLSLIAVTADNLSIKLEAGTYYFGLTPDVEYSKYGQQFRYDSGSTIGAGSAYRNPLGGFGLPAGTDWGNVNPEIVPGYGDASMTITGTAIPEPATAGHLASVCVGLVVRRRR